MAFNKLLYPPTQNGLQKSLGSQLDSGVTASLSLNNTTGIQNKPGVLVVDRIDTTGAAKSASDREYIYYEGVSGSTLTGLTRGLSGSTDQDHVVGAIVEFVPDVNVFEELMSAMANIVDPDDTTSVNETNIVTPDATQTLTNKTLTSPVIDGDVSGSGVLDEDDMSSDSDTALATQQSIKAYTDTKLSQTANASGSDIITGTSTVKYVTPKSISDAGLTYYPISQNATISDNNYTTITPSLSSGMLTISSSSNNTVGLIATYKVGTSPICVSLGAASAVNVTTGALNGTTGTDGKATISTHTDGSIYIENRLGGTTTFIIKYF